jgi:hypothetical protein
MYINALGNVVFEKDNIVTRNYKGNYSKCYSFSTPKSMSQFVRHNGKIIQVKRKAIPVTVHGGP